jgi:hypothetical protein
LRESYKSDNCLDEPATHILHGIPTGATYEKVTEVLENHYSDHHLYAMFHSQPKRRTMIIRESLQEFATTNNHLTHCGHVQLPKHLISKEAAHAFVNGIKDGHVRR